MELRKVPGDALVMLVANKIAREALQHFDGVRTVVRVSVGELCRGNLRTRLGKNYVYPQRLTADMSRDLCEQRVAHVLRDGDEMWLYG